MFKRSLTVLLLLIAFSLSVVSVGFGKNQPRWLDEKDPVDHPWGGDENPDPRDGSGGNPGGISPQHYDSYTFVYGSGTKTGLIVGLFELVWNQTRGLVIRLGSGEFSSQSTGTRGSVGSTAINSESAGSGKDGR